MEYTISRKIQSARYGAYNAYAYFLQVLKNSVSLHSGSILIINHRLPAKLLIAIAEHNHADIDIIKPFDCGTYHAGNGTVFHDRSTILVFQPMSFTQEICIAKQFCGQYGANAVLVKPFGIANLYEVWLKEYMNI